MFPTYPKKEKNVFELSRETNTQMKDDFGVLA